jgi:hypothetical protein
MVNERPEARPDSKLLDLVYLIALSTLPLFISLDIPQGPPAVVTNGRTNGKFRNPKTPKSVCSHTAKKTNNKGHSFVEGGIAVVF